MPSSPSSPSSSAAATTTVLHDEHALLAAYETRPTRPKRSSSERSKEFRAKRKKYESEVQQSVDSLRREVAELTMRHNIWQEKLVHLRTNLSGSLAKLVREYYLVFQHGLALSDPSPSSSSTSSSSTSSSSYMENPKTKYQLDFLRQAMDPEVQVGDEVGIPALVEQWRVYTMAHASLFVQVGDVTMLGSDEDPVLLLCSKVHVQYSRATFEIMFPGALAHAPALVDKFMGKHVVYDCVTYFRFTSEGRICFYDHDMGLVEGLLRVADSISDVLALMKYCSCEIPRRNHDAMPTDRIHVKVESVQAVHSNQQSGKSECGSPSSSSGDESDRRKLTMNFLLS